MTDSVRPLFSADVNIAKQQAYLFRDLLKYHCNINLSKSQTLDCFAQTFHQENWASLMATLRTEEKDWTYYAYPGYLTLNYGKNLKSALLNHGHKVDHCAYRVITDMPLENYTIARAPESAALCTILGGNATWTIPNLLAQYKSQGSCDDFVIYDKSSDHPHIPVRFSSDPLTGNERLVAFNITSEKEVLLNPANIRFMPDALTIVIPDTSAVKHPHSLPYALAKQWMKNGGLILITPGDDDYSHIFEDDIDASLQHVSKNNPGKQLYFFAINLSVHHPIERWERSYKESRNILPLLENASRKFDAGLNALLNNSDRNNSDIESGLKDLYRDYNDIAKLAVLSFWEDTKEINSQSSLLMTYCPSSKEDSGHFITPKELSGLIG